MQAAAALRQQRRRQAGFSVMELMVVILISCILLTVAVPNFVKARDLSNQRTCIAQLEQIDAAKRQYALDQKKSDTDTILMSDIAGPDKYVRGVVTGPTCPADGVYSLGNVATSPTCSLGGYHALP